MLNISNIDFLKSKIDVKWCMRVNQKSVIELNFIVFHQQNDLG